MPRVKKSKKVENVENVENVEAVQTNEQAQTADQNVDQPVEVSANVEQAEETSNTTSSPVAVVAGIKDEIANLQATLQAITNISNVTGHVNCSLTEHDIYRCVDITIAQNNLSITEDEVINQFETVEAFQGWKERMQIRIDMYRNRVGVEEIERYIYKYILKQEFPAEFNAPTVNYLMQSLTEFKEIPIAPKKQNAGRPKLPDELKKYIMAYNKEKIKVNNTNKYRQSQKYEKIQANLLSADELSQLLAVIPKKHQSILAGVMKKLQTFVAA